MAKKEPKRVTRRNANKSIYALSICSVNDITGEVGHFAAAALELSDSDAITRAIELGDKAYPEADGWQEPSTNVLKIS